jgi:hypothetical protein
MRVRYREERVALIPANEESDTLSDLDWVLLCESLVRRQLADLNTFWPAGFLVRVALDEMVFLYYPDKEVPPPEADVALFLKQQTIDHEQVSHGYNSLASISVSPVFSEKGQNRHKQVWGVILANRQREWKQEYLFHKNSGGRWLMSRALLVEQ